MKVYSKPSLTIDQQIALLEERGLSIPDHKRASRHLSNISYYRLSAYMLPFREIGPDGKHLDKFVDGATWDDVYSLYKFDRKFRLLVFDAIERIEIALRTQVINQLSAKYGTHWKDDKSLFRDYKNKKTGQTYDIFLDIQKHINEQLTANKKATFIDHYLKNYDDPPTPPCWMSVELLYFSEVSKICQHLKQRKDRIDISKAFGVIDDAVFCSWLHALNYVRNICAHHARLWNITLDITPMKYINKNPKMVWLDADEVSVVSTTKIYYTLCYILYLLQTINPKTKFRKHFKDLLAEYKVVNVKYMGFPEGWENKPLWKN